MTSSSGKRIVFTGGSGKAGRYVIPYLLAHGHRVLNLDLIPFPDPSVDVYTLKTDLTDSGQVFNALTSQLNMAGYEDDKVPGPPDVVIHFAAYARNMLVPDSLLFPANVTSTYNVIEAAAKLGVKKVIIASSETTYGVCFAQGNKDYHHFPLEEDYDCDPEDSYALSKLCNERTARTFTSRFKDLDIYCLRIGNVISPEDYATLFPTFLASSAFNANPLARKRNAWSYIDARDLGQICHLCIEKSGLGYQVFNATNDGITIPEGETSEGFLKKVHPKTDIKRKMGDREAPLSNRKIKEVLGFKEEYDFRREVDLKALKEQ
ncbi:putative UDP-glucose 4-epimerase [Amylocarpus encephaloides]|uniref:UDP-glucose 4-epimerase n=1 Tax=Amylocarpus encephaloides TaxID=45428 RepID=A0A9P7YQ75_9HELO|nr:putative UDP-glucose 4-epimerase [Amylocarpus encephaloides]